MKTAFLKLVSCSGLLLSVSLEPAAAALFTLSDNYTTSLSIPDNDPTGISDTRQFSMPGAVGIIDLQVNLKISGGCNGDYYAFLRHGTTGFAVLLNRVGVTGANPDGYADPGINVTLSDSALRGDIHLYQTVLDPRGEILTGAWQPDGRSVDPSFATDQSTRGAMLSSFTGMDPNGDWTLFFADTSPLGTGTLVGWGLTISSEVIAVPEPNSFLPSLFFVGVVILCSRLWRKRPVD